MTSFAVARVAAAILLGGSAVISHAQDTVVTQSAPVAMEQSSSVSMQQSPSVSTYRINPGDEIEIYVWGEERLQRVLRVLPDGTIAFPLVGQLKAAGLLPQDLEATVSERLRAQYRGEVPAVTVSVRAPDGQQFSVMGKVKSPGTFTVPRYVNVLDALSLAGGPAEFANLGNVMIITKRNGQLEVITSKLYDLFRSGAGSQDLARANVVQIAPGDVIIVP